jgi:hypothetical protein
MELDVFSRNFQDLFMDVLGGDIPPEKIHEEIKKVAQEQYYYHKHMCSRAYEFLSSFNDIGGIEGLDKSTFLCQSGQLEMCDDKETQNTWTLPVNVDGLTGDCLITLPDDLLEKVGWKENDQLEWVDRGDSSFELRKV